MNNMLVIKSQLHRWHACKYAFNSDASDDLVEIKGRQ